MDAEVLFISKHLSQLLLLISLLGSWRNSTIGTAKPDLIPKDRVSPGQEIMSQKN